METKFCKCCCVEKDVKWFYRNRTKKDGYASVCKKCKGEGGLIRKKAKRGFKICPCCKVESPIEEFWKSKSKKDGLHCFCILCSKKKAKASREKNRDKIKQRTIKFKITHPEYKKEYDKLWKIKNPSYLNSFNKRKRNEDPLYKLSGNIRSLISSSLRTSGFKKNTKTEQILGCSFEEFKLYLESKFEPWMCWNNVGRFKNEKMIKNKFWQLDHIIPISSAKTEEEEIYRLNHYTNFQPLDAFDNCITKRNKM